MLFFVIYRHFVQNTEEQNTAIMYGYLIAATIDLGITLHLGLYLTLVYMVCALSFFLAHYAQDV